MSNDQITKIINPYYVAPSDDIIFQAHQDFNRRTVKPGTDSSFPDGMIEICVDGYFWTVAALPYLYLDIPISDIITEFWPSLQPLRNDKS